MCLGKSKRASTQMSIDEDAESDDGNDLSQRRSDDDEFCNYILLRHLYFLYCI